MGIGGRAIASLISSPDLGVWSLVKLACLDVICFLGLVGVCVDPEVAMTSAARTVPRLVRFCVQVTRWNFGEVENSLGRFLDMVETGNGRVMRRDHSG